MEGKRKASKKIVVASHLSASCVVLGFAIWALVNHGPGSLNFIGMLTMLVAYTIGWTTTERKRLRR